MSHMKAVCLLMFFGLLCLDIISAKAVKTDDLETASSGGKEHKKYYSRGDGSEYEHGFAKSSEDKGTGGYDKFETFDTKDGDAYNSEKHEGFGNTKNDGDDDHEYEEGYKYSHSSNYKHGDNGDNHNEEYSSAGSKENDDGGNGESESYRRSYTEDESESEESDEEDNDKDETRSAGQIIYGTHPNEQVIVQQPSGPSSSKSKAPTHHQYVFFGNSDIKKFPKKSQRIKGSSPQKKRDRTTSGLNMDSLKGYSSYVVHKPPRATNIGHAISSSLVNVGASIKVAGNGNYNEATVTPDLHGYPSLKLKSAGGYVNTNYRPTYVDNTREENGDITDHDRRYDSGKQQKGTYTYEDGSDYE